MRIDRWKALWSVAVLAIFGGAVVSVFAGDETATPKGSPSPLVTEAAADGNNDDSDESSIHKTSDGCLADAATLEDLRRQKRELEARTRDLSSRESELRARETALADEMKKLVEARDEFSKMDGDRKKENEGKVAKLVETIESMNPKAASALVSAIDEGLAVQAMSRLSTPKLAKMMNVMDPQRSTKLSELLVGVTRAKRVKSTSNDGVAAVTAERALSPRKGGDEDDGKSHEQASNKSNGVGGDALSAHRQPAGSTESGAASEKGTAK